MMCEEKSKKGKIIWTEGNRAKLINISYSKMWDKEMLLISLIPPQAWSYQLRKYHMDHSRYWNSCISIKNECISVRLLVFYWMYFLIFIDKKFSSQFCAFCLMKLHFAIFFHIPDLLCNKTKCSIIEMALGIGFITIDKIYFHLIFCIDY